MTRCTSPLARALLRLAPVLCATLLAAAAPAGAQEPPAPAVSAETLIEAARAALAAGEADDAAFLLEGVAPGEGDADDLDFLHGSIAMARGDWQAAIERFRAMLARDPNLLRVRLDLALAYFQAGEDASAAYHFRQALGAEGLPEVARVNALAFLDRIRRRKAWSVTGSLAVAPDSNINQATGARLVELFGLPAHLSEDARRTSGVGLAASLGGAYEARLAPDLRLRTSAALQTRTYAASRFNDRTLTLRAGPRFLFERLEVRPALSVRGRTLGNDLFSRAAGASLAGDWLAAPAWRLSASLGAERVFYTTFLGAGTVYSATLGLAHAAGQATLLRADAALRRESLERDAYSWREAAVEASAARELPGGFVLTAAPGFRWRGYDAALPALGRDPRRDRTLSARVTVSNRRVSLFGFMPEVTVRHERRHSTLDLYDYTRTAAELGVVRTF